jgi:NTP pyrophosphatase (non-canonical NTP hydrolase)
MTELGEAYHAHALESKEAFAEELADVAIYLLGLSEIAGVDLVAEILKKM